MQAKPTQPLSRPAASTDVLPARRWLWWAVTGALVVVALLILAMLILATNWYGIASALPVDLRSPLRANYAADPRNLAIQPVKLNLAAESLADEPLVGSPGMDQAAYLDNLLRTPVPTVVNGPGETSSPPTAAPSPAVVTATLAIAPTEAAPEASSTPNWILPYPTATLVILMPISTPVIPATPAPGATATPQVIPNNTQPPAATPTMSATPEGWISPTPTFTPTVTLTPTLTRTPTVTATNPGSYPPPSPGYPGP